MPGTGGMIHIVEKNSTNKEANGRVSFNGALERSRIEKNSIKHCHGSSDCKELYRRRRKKKSSDIYRRNSGRLKAKMKGSEFGGEK